MALWKGGIGLFFLLAKKNNATKMIPLVDVVVVMDVVVAAPVEILSV